MDSLLEDLDDLIDEAFRDHGSFGDAKAAMIDSAERVARKIAAAEPGERLMLRDMASEFYRLRLAEAVQNFSAKSPLH